MITTTANAAAAAARSAKEFSSSGGSSNRSKKILLHPTDNNKKEKTSPSSSKSRSRYSKMMMRIFPGSSSSSSSSIGKESSDASGAASHSSSSLLAGGGSVYSLRGRGELPSWTDKDKCQALTVLQTAMDQQLRKQSTLLAAMEHAFRFAEARYFSGNAIGGQLSVRQFFAHEKEHKQVAQVLFELEDVMDLIEASDYALDYKQMIERIINAAPPPAAAAYESHPCCCADALVAKKKKKKTQVFAGLEHQEMLNDLQKRLRQAEEASHSSNPQHARACAA